MKPPEEKPLTEEEKAEYAKVFRETHGKIGITDYLKWVEGYIPGSLFKHWIESPEEMVTAVEKNLGYVLTIWKSNHMEEMLSNFDRARLHVSPVTGGFVLLIGGKELIRVFLPDPNVQVEVDPRTAKVSEMKELETAPVGMIRYCPPLEGRHDLVFLGERKSNGLLIFYDEIGGRWYGFGAKYEAEKYAEGGASLWSDLGPATSACEPYDEDHFVRWGNAIQGLAVIEIRSLESLETTASSIIQLPPGGTLVGSIFVANVIGNSWLFTAINGHILIEKGDNHRKSLWEVPLTPCVGPPQPEHLEPSNPKLIFTFPVHINHSVIQWDKKTTGQHRTDRIAILYSHEEPMVFGRFWDCIIYDFLTGTSFPHPCNPGSVYRFHDRLVGDDVLIDYNAGIEDHPDYRNAVVSLSKGGGGREQVPGIHRYLWKIDQQTLVTFADDQLYVYRAVASPGDLRPLFKTPGIYPASEDKPGSTKGKLANVFAKLHISHHTQDP